MQNQTNNRIVFHLNELGFNRCSQFGYYRYTEVKPRLKTHLHPDIIEICYCLKGQQFYNIVDETHKLHGNDIIIVSPNTKHSTGIYPEDKGELFWIQIGLNNSEGKLCNLPFDQSDHLLRRLADQSNNVFKGPFSIKPILEKILDQLKQPQELLTQITVNQLIVQLLLETLVFSEKIQQLKPNKRLEVIDTFIAENLNRPLYVDELADLINISTSYFKTWFKAHTGITPKEYINRVKIKRAKIDLLREKTITKVAFNLGYNSSQYFATSFKKFTGTTPKAYIATHKNQINNL